MVSIEKTAKELATLLKKEKRVVKQLESVREDISSQKEFISGQFDKLGLTSSFS